MRNGMLTIMELAAREDGGHSLQSQSGRTECWLEGWIAVPETLEDAVWDCGGYCEPEIVDGVLTGIVPNDRPAPPAPEPSEEQKLSVQVKALEEQLTTAQLALCDVYELLVGGEEIG